LTELKGIIQDIYQPFEAGMVGMQQGGGGVNIIGVGGMAGEGDVIGGGDGLAGPNIFVGQGVDIQYQQGQQFGPLVGEGGGRRGSLVSIIQQNIMGDMGTGLIDTPAPKEYYFINAGGTGMERGGFAPPPDLTWGALTTVGEVKQFIDHLESTPTGAMNRLRMTELEGSNIMPRYRDVKNLIDSLDDDDIISDLPRAQQTVITGAARQLGYQSLRRDPDETAAFETWVRSAQARGIDFIGEQTLHTAGELANVGVVTAFGKVGENIDPETLREVTLPGMGRRRLDFYLSGVEMGAGTATYVDDGSGDRPTQTIWSEFKTGSAGADAINKGIADARDVIKTWMEENRAKPTPDLLKLQMVARRFSAGAVAGAEGLWGDLMTGVFASAFQAGQISDPSVPEWMQRLDFEQGGALRFRAYGQQLPADVNEQLQGMNKAQIGIFLGSLFTSDVAGYATDLNPNMRQTDLREYFEEERQRANRIRERIRGGRERVESAIETPLEEDDALTYIQDLKDRVEDDKQKITDIREANKQDEQRLRRGSQELEEVTGLGGFGRVTQEENLRRKVREGYGFLQDLPELQQQDVPLLGRAGAIFSPELFFCFWCRESFTGSPFGEQKDVNCPSCGNPVDNWYILPVDEGWTSWEVQNDVMYGEEVPERLMLPGIPEEQFTTMIRDLTGRKLSGLMSGKGLNQELFPFLYSGTARQPRTRGGQYTFSEMTELGGIDYFREDLLKTVTKGVEGWMSRGMGFTSVSMDRSFDEIYASYKRGMQGDEEFQSLSGKISEALTGGDKIYDAERFRQMQDRFKKAVDQSQINPNITKLNAIKGVVAGMDMREVMLLSMDYARVTSEAEMRGDNTIIQNSIFKAWGNTKQEVMSYMERIKDELDESFDTDAKKLLDNYSLLTDKLLNVGVATDAIIWFPTELNSGT
jgi:hypothetical protein